jgi:hypothetical protein
VMKNGVYPFFCSFLTELSSRPERSAVEGPAAHPSALPSSPSQSSKPKQRCHPDRSVAQWRGQQRTPRRSRVLPLNLQSPNRGVIPTGA